MDRNWVAAGRGSRVTQRLRRAQALRHARGEQACQTPGPTCWVRGLLWLAPDVHAGRRCHRYRFPCPRKMEMVTAWAGGQEGSGRKDRVKALSAVPSQGRRGHSGPAVRDGKYRDTCTWRRRWRFASSFLAWGPTREPWPVQQDLCR